jgi:acetyl-CoA carboxylase biotin carboxylase subunit
MKKVLIANRGEIAVRIIRACHDLGLKTVAVYSEADAQALHVLLADEAVCIGEAPSAKSYLKISNIIAACEITGADSVHPGYGFLSENAKFAQICEESGLTFIGPSSATIAQLGDKVQAKQIAKRAGCPIIPGSDGVVESLEQGMQIAQDIGFPVFIKASAGGGGKGIRIAYDSEDFKSKFMQAKTEAQAAFNNADVYLEKKIEHPRHIEIQLLCDKYGHCLYLGERDCTIQRRRQKLIEETPSPVLSAALRKKIGEAAVAIAKEANYHTVGTVEFLLDKDQNFYFMEVNTRIQVEHTVTEEVTGIDLIVEQIKTADGHELTIQQEDIEMKGHVMQFRINAENPARQFAPSPGLLEFYVPPGGPHVRVDSACYAGYKIPPNYDSMIAKLIIKGTSRQQVIAKALRALKEFHIGDIHTTIPFHLNMLSHPTFLSGQYTLDFIDKLIESGYEFTEPKS